MSYYRKRVKHRRISPCALLRDFLAITRKCQVFSAVRSPYCVTVSAHREPEPIYKFRHIDII
jgi:hypothetical protein